jgi:hypothetical protein
MAEERRVISQDEGDRFALDHGTVAVRGIRDEPAVRHEVTGAVLHGSPPGQPLMHMVCWDEEPCHVDVEVSGRVALTGDAEAPVVVRMQHEFTTDHHQTLTVEPIDHNLHVDSAVASPIHHALQMRTPLELRFCNPWHIASDYRVEVNLGESRVIGIRLSGATVATPQPCNRQDGCPPTDTEGVKP